MVRGAFFLLLLFAVPCFAEESEPKKTDHDAVKEESSETEDASTEASSKKQSVPQTPEEKIEKLLQALGSEDYQEVEYAMYGLQGFNQQAVAPVIKLIQNTETTNRTRMNAIHFLGRLGKVSRPALPVLIPFLASEEDDLVAVTAITLGKIRDDSSGITVRLASLLQHKSEWVKKSAQQALEYIGTPQAREYLKRYRAKIVKNTTPKH